MIDIDDNELLEFWFPQLDTLKIIGRWFNNSSKEMIFLLQDKNNAFTFEHWKFQSTQFGTGWHKSQGLEAGIYQTQEIATNEITGIYPWVKNKNIEPSTR